jgi:hypothetical protein
MATHSFLNKPLHANSGGTNPKLMIAAVVLLVIVVSLGIVFAINSSRPPYIPAVTGAPHAEFSTRLIDHGDVQMDAYVESVFRIRNTGDQPLRILEEPRVQLVLGCCPPRARASQMTIQPGEEATISLRFTMHEMMGGPHEFRVYVPTNDPTQPVIPLTILSNWIE